MNSHKSARWLFPTPAILFVLAMMVFPIVYTIRVSLTRWSLSTGVPDKFTGFGNYSKALLADTRFHDAVLRTLYFTVVAVAVEVLLGVAVALLLNRDFKGKNLVKTAFLLPMVATPVAIGMVFMLMYEPTAGILNYMLKLLHLPGLRWVAGSSSVIPALALVDIWEWTPMIALIAMAGLAALPSDPFEAARVDGATPGQMLRLITLPLLRPTIFIATMLRAIDALKTFDIIYTITDGGPGYASETLNIYIYQQAFRYYNFGYASSLLVIFLALVLGVGLLLTYARRSWEA